MTPREEFWNWIEQLMEIHAEETEDEVFKEYNELLTIAFGEEGEARKLVIKREE